MLYKYVNGQWVFKSASSYKQGVAYTNKAWVAPNVEARNVRGRFGAGWYDALVYVEWYSSGAWRSGTAYQVSYYNNYYSGGHWTIGSGTTAACYFP